MDFPWLMQIYPYLALQKLSASVWVLLVHIECKIYISLHIMNWSQCPHAHTHTRRERKWERTTDELWRKQGKGLHTHSVTHLVIFSAVWVCSSHCVLAHMHSYDHATRILGNQKMSQTSSTFVICGSFSAVQQRILESRNQVWMLLAMVWSPSMWLGSH